MLRLRRLLIWNRYSYGKSIRAQTVAFIAEDDAPNGADHVDAHSIAYFAGGYIKETLQIIRYTTASMLRTPALLPACSHH